MIVVFNPELEAMKRTHYYDHSRDESVARYLGYSLIFHNTDLSMKDVVRRYFDKDTVEKAFSHIKPHLEPFFSRSENGTRTRLFLTVLGYTLVAMMA